MILTVDAGTTRYPIHIARGALARAGEIFSLDRRVLIVTDSGVPAAYAAEVAKHCLAPQIVCMPQGEASKSPEGYLFLLSKLLEGRFDRRDCVVAVGGGVVGDLAGFAAATYMRGIDFYGVPTTLLSQVDSSIGGKTGIDFKGFKNIIGAFYQPKAVLIDPDVLATLSPRLFAEGFAEIVKMALTFDAAFFEKLENDAAKTDIEYVITRALELKRDVVQKDPLENGLRRVLNFGHTLGHGIESEQAGKLYHGECVALGMLPMCAPPVRARLAALLEKAGLPTVYTGDPAAALAAVRHDKKFSGDTVTTVFVPRIGTFCEETCTMRELETRLNTIREVRA